jgi:D-apiose dehydrogenase
LQVDVPVTSRAAVVKKRVAIVGAGFFCQFHLDGWTSMDNVEVVGICDIDLARAQALAQRYGLTQAFDNLQTMLDQTAPEIVDVVTTPASQASILSVLLPRALTVICQKPFGASYAQALFLTNLAEKHGATLIVHENFRFTPWFREARRCIDAGLLGELYGVSFRLRPGDGQGPRAYLDRQPYFQTMPRLLMAETGVHLIDTFRFLMGEVTAVYAHLRRLNPVIKGEDACLVNLEFGNGACGLLDANRLSGHVANNPRRTMGEMWLEGSQGVLRLDGDAGLWWKPHHGNEIPHPYDACPGNASFGAGACEALQRHVLDCLDRGVPAHNTARSYLSNLLVQEAVYVSHTRGQRVEMDSFESTNADVLDSAPGGFTPRHLQPQKETT